MDFFRRLAAMMKPAAGAALALLPTTIYAQPHAEPQMESVFLREQSRMRSPRANRGASNGWKLNRASMARCRFPYSRRGTFTCMVITECEKKSTRRALPSALEVLKSARMTSTYRKSREHWLSIRHTWFSHHLFHDSVSFPPNEAEPERDAIAKKREAVQKLFWRDSSLHRRERRVREELGRRKNMGSVCCELE